MAQAPTILWIENDYLDGVELHLTEQGCCLLRAFQAFRAEEFLVSDGGRIDLVLLDVMMDLEDADAERGYTPGNTKQSYRTGLEFYRRNHRLLANLRIPV